MSIPELSGRRVVLVPMRHEEGDLLQRWLSDPENQPHWFGRAVSRGDVGKRWGSEYFDDAYPQKGRGFRVDAGGKPVGAVMHGPVFGDPRNALLELVLAPGTDPSLGADALNAIVQYVFDALLARKAWAEVPPDDARALAAFQGAGFAETGRTAEGGRRVLLRERPPAKRHGTVGAGAGSTKPK